VHFSFNADFRLDDAEAARLSPLHLPVRVDAPLLMAVGADETSEFVRQTQLLWDAWPRNRRPADDGPLLLSGKHHFSVVLDHADRSSDLTGATLALF
jgi:arylformamidase